jgi:hypothetical protein
VLTGGDPSPEYAADRDEVGRHQGNEEERDNGVEGDVRADIDEREETGDDAAQRDGVEGTEEARVGLMYINSASTLM